MVEKYFISEIEKKAKIYGDYSIERGKGVNYFINEKREKTPLMIAGTGMINDEGVDRIAKEISREKRKKQSDIFLDLTTKRSLEREMAISFLILSTIGLIFFSSIKAKIITGFAISNLSNSTINMLLFICFCVTLGLFYSIYLKKRR